MKYQILLISILLFRIISCNNDDDCTDTFLNTTSLEIEYGFKKTKYQMDIELSENFIIIRNQFDFSDFVSETCQPAIDFSIYDLIIGKKELANGNSFIDYGLVENCETRNQNIIVTANQNETTEAANLTYHALVPKLGDEQELSVEIIIN
jgi:hypothetical protein